MSFSRIQLFLLGVTINFVACKQSYVGEENFAQALPEKVDYNFHIKPLLSDRCYACHGPDENTREADLRLDIEEQALGVLANSQGKYAIKAGSRGKSQVYHRIYTDDPEEQMPPPASNLQLSDYEKALITKWIDQGAEWKPHWAFIPPEKSSIPSIHSGWGKNEVDAFIGEQLENADIEAAPQANSERLLRRLYADLTGLPPSIADMDEFMTDHSEEAYEKMVDQLLETDAYAERMALEWMDVARYADSHGMHADGWRMMWPWRDWVIKAFKQNMPYDEFIKLQLAGDMVENAGRDEILATAFHRNHPMTAEGGVVDEEFRLAYVIDRTNTTAKAFMGMTMECSQCHDHKFDPISQKEYFQFSAFFNNVKELGMTGDDGNYGPMLPLPDKATEEKLNSLQNDIREKEQQLLLQKKEIQQTKDFLSKFSPKAPRPAQSYPFDHLGKKYTDRNRNTEVFGEPEIVKGKKGNAVRLDGNFEYIHLKEVGDYELSDAFSASLWVKPDSGGKPQTLLGNAGDKNNFWRGWLLEINENNQPFLQLINSYPHNYIHEEALHSIQPGKWNHIVATYDGSAQAKGIRIYINGEQSPTKTVFDQLYKSIKTIKSGDHQLTKRPLRVGRSYRAFTGENGIFTGAIDEIKIFDQRLSEWEASYLLIQLKSRKCLKIVLSTNLY